jgi:hypothetical protein
MCGSTASILIRYSIDPWRSSAKTVFGRQRRQDQARIRDFWTGSRGRKEEGTPSSENPLWTGLVPPYDFAMTVPKPAPDRTTSAAT